VNPGGTLTVHSTGWKPGTEVVVTLQSDPITLGSAVANSVGEVNASFTVPVGFAIGSHTVSLTGLNIAGNVRTVSAPITVAAIASAVQPAAQPAQAQPAATTSSLPATGSDTGSLAVIAVLLLGTGVALVATGHRRRTDS
jgi:LPXTG-motif cell wall-anchored protein